MKKGLLFLVAICMVQFSLVAQTVEFSDDFESGTANWVLEGAWGLTTSQSNSPSNSLTDSPAGNYAANQDVSATMAMGVDLSAALDAELNFAAIYDIEDGNFDYCYVEASNDMGATWINVATIFGQGNLSPWVDYAYSLGGFAGDSDVRVRFRFFSDGGFEVDGIYIDDVEIVSSDVDNGVPLILHTAPELYLGSAGDVIMDAELIDVSGIGSTTLFYSVDGGAAVSVTGMNTGANAYAYTIPAQAAGSQVDYFIEAIDASANTNTASTATYSYIAGQHVYYDNGITDFIAAFGPAQGAGAGAAVRFTLSDNNVVFALIRNYTDQNNPNDPMMFHIWADDNGLPGADLVTPFEVVPEANLVETSPMTRIDLSAYAAQLSNITGDVFMGYTVAVGQTFLTQSTPGTGGRSYVQDAAGVWTPNLADDYHFRLVTTATVASDDCAAATNLNGLLGGVVNTPLTSAMFNNDDATVGANDPTDGFACWGEPDGGGATPSIENSQWFTFTGDGETYSILTTDCNGTVTDYIDFGDTQIAIYSGADCDNLTAVDCNEDVAGTDPNGPYPAGLDFPTEDGVVYYMMVDGFAGSNGEYCIEFTRIANITCDDITLNVPTTTAPDVCFNATTAFDLTGTVVPLGGISGFTWGIFTADVTGSMDPFSDPNALGFFGASPAEYTPALLNDGTQVPAGTYFFTPIVYGEATDTVGDGAFASLSFADGCVITGTSVEVTLWPALDDISGSVSTVDEMLPPGNNGEASVGSTIGGSGSYTYLWSNGETTPTITGLTAGDYTVTISDISGCATEDVQTATVGMIVGIDEVEFESSIRVFPNPANQMTNVQFDFSESVDLTISLTNTLGQVVLERGVANAQNGSVALDLNAFSNGVYLIRLSDGENEVTKRLMIAK